MRACLALLLLVLPGVSHADVYTLGSSFTWDARPPDLDAAPKWHIECGKSLIYIHDNPAAPCVASSTVWTTGLALTNYDAISFQPVPGATSSLGNDLFAIHSFLADQPDAAIVLQQTWPVPLEWESTFHGPSDPGATNRSLAYGYTLMAWLEVLYPERTIVLTRSNEMLDHIYHDCLDGCDLPGGFMRLFRDLSGHMDTVGRYLQHNALRGAFGQTVGVQLPQPDQQVSASEKAYLDAVVAQYLPEPGADLSLLVGAAAVGGLARRRRSRAC